MSSASQHSAPSEIEDARFRKLWFPSLPIDMHNELVGSRDIISRAEIIALRLHETFDPFHRPAFSIAALAVLAEAMAGSYMALLAVEHTKMQPLELTIFLTLSAISSIGVTTLFGRWHDKTPRLWPLVLCILAGILGYMLCGILTTPWMLMAIAFLLLGLASASYPLLFAIAKASLNGTGSTAESRGMAALRMIASISWAVGPAIGERRAVRHVDSVPRPPQLHY